MRPRPPDRHQHDGGDREAQEGRPRGAELVEQRDGEPGPELERADGGDDKRDAARLLAHLRPVTTVRSYSGSLRICASVKRIGSHCFCENSRVWSA